MPAAADLWSLVQGQPYVDAQALADAVAAQVEAGGLDYRTRLLIRDSLDALEGFWGKGKFDAWLRRSAAEAELEALWREPHESVGFPSLRRRVMNPTTQEQLEQVFRLVGSRLRRPVSGAIGGSPSLILNGLVSRQTEVIDFVDEVPAEVRADHKVQEEIQEAFDLLHPGHFQQHYLPSGWSDRVRTLAPYGNLSLALVDPADVFMSMLTSIREKDLKDLRELASKLDKSALVERLRSSMESTFASAELKRRATQNWYVLFGEELPT